MFYKGKGFLSRDGCGFFLLFDIVFTMQFSGKYLVVTGGAGFIGSGVIRALNERNISEIVIVDDLGQSEKWKNLVGKQFIDIIHKDSLFDWLEDRESEISAFIHLGACSSTVETDAHYLLENNYRYSKRLAAYALTHGHRFIYASSAATYGDGALGFSDTADLNQFKPLNMYGYSKHLFDLWLSRQNVLDKVVGLKYFNVFGPNEYHKGRMASAIIKMVPDVLQTGQIKLFRSSEPDKYLDGGQIRDFIYVKDIAEMTIQFLNNDRSGIFNMGSGNEHTWNDLAHAVFLALEKKADIAYVDMPLDLRGKYQNYTCADMSQSHDLFQPKYSLEAAVKDYLKNYLIRGQYW
jgi:ADP-L-glycero-D-manno-heptose 6-epimerase